MALKENMWLNNTPNTKRQEPVFKTPMTFSPRLLGERIRPSPSRMEIWRAQLGLEDDTDTSSDRTTDDESEDAKSTSSQGSCSLIEYRALTRELEERNSQRDDLLLRIKTLTDKNKHYRSRLQKEENAKKQQIKIIRKAHDAQVEEKESLIKTLQLLVEEQEIQLQKKDPQQAGEDKGAVEDKEDEDNKDESLGKPASATQSLIQQISRLEAQKVELVSELATMQVENEALLKEQEEQRLNQVINKQLHSDKQKLEEEMLKLRQEKKSCNTETEMQLQKLEIENDQLQAELSDAQRKFTKVTASASTNKILEEENKYLKEKVKFLEEELTNKASQLNNTESHMKVQVKKLANENQNTSSELRSLRAELFALHARPPDVVTKVERVEIESEVMKRQLEKVSQENIEMRAALTKLKLDCESQSEVVVNSNAKVSLLETQVSTYQKEIEELRTETSRKIADLESAKLSAVEEVKKETEDKLRRLSGNFDHLRSQLSVIKPVLNEISNQHQVLREQVKQMPSMFKSMLTSTRKQICTALGEVNKVNADLVQKYRKEMKLRKKYHNELVELKGNIRVFCRVRPKIKEDGSGEPSEMVVSFDRDDDGLVNVVYKGRPQRFEMDQVFTDTSTQEEVFGEVSALVTSCIDGYNVCIFAYGQTGSGKTYTMEGPTKNPGINQRALRELFRETEDRGTEWDYTIKVSVVEIYNETLRDLLSSDNSNKLEIKKTQDGGIHVPGLTSVVVNSVDDVNQVFSLGKKNRATATTNMNEHSSRSHALLCIQVTGVNTTTGVKSIGKLNLVDLAGSERISKSGAEGARLKEAQNINKSLSCVGDVIHALRSKQSHIPYRNSKLTYLLQDSLGGDSKTLMIVQVSPVEKNVGETVASLNFAQRVRCVELGTATKKVENGDNHDVRDKLMHLEESNGFHRSPSARRWTPRKK